MFCFLLDIVKLVLEEEKHLAQQESQPHVLFLLQEEMLVATVPVVHFSVTIGYFADETNPVQTHCSLPWLQCLHR